MQCNAAQEMCVSIACRDSNLLSLSQFLACKFLRPVETNAGLEYIFLEPVPISKGWPFCMPQIAINTI